MTVETLDRPAGAAAPAERRLVTGGEGRRLAYVEAGRGTAVLLIHGALTNLDDMVLGPFDALARACRVIAFDRPGHGASPRRRLEDASPWRQAGLIHQAARALGVERAVVVGHSFGGAVAMAYGMAYPQDTEGVVALAPIAWPEPRLEQLLFGARAAPVAGPWLDLAARDTIDRALLPLLWRAMFLPQPMPERFEHGFSFESAARAQTTVATGEDAAAIGTALWRSVAGYATCKVPVRILGGDRDLVVNNAVHGAVLGRILPAGRFEWVRGMGHMLHHFAVDRVVSAVAALAGREAPPSAAG